MNTHVDQHQPIQLPPEMSRMQYNFKFQISYSQCTQFIMMLLVKIIEFLAQGFERKGLLHKKNCPKGLQKASKSIVFKRQLNTCDIAGIKDMIEEELKDESNKKLYYFARLNGSTKERKRIDENLNQLDDSSIFFNDKDGLTIDDQIFREELIIDQEAGQTVELSDFALQKLKSIFDLYASTLTQNQFSSSFYAVMYQTRFPLLQQYHPQSQYIDLTLWLALWKAFTFFNSKDTYKLLTYFGIDIKISDAFTEQNKKDSWYSVQKSLREEFFIQLFLLKTKSNQVPMQIRKSQKDN